MAEKFTESDLYRPICDFLETEGFAVRGEVKDCDMAAVKGDRLLIVELKKSFNLKLVYQALDRQALAKEVFVAIPRPAKGQNSREWKSMLKLLKRLELGLITVALDSPVQTVDVLLEPSDSLAWKNRKKTAALKQEIEGRAADFNTGGITRRKIVTAYREKSVELCCILEGKGQVSYQELRELGLLEKQIKILGSNFYGWFQRVKRGIYCLSEEGKKVMSDKEMEEITFYYRNKWK